MGAAAQGKPRSDAMYEFWHASFGSLIVVAIGDGTGQNLAHSPACPAPMRQNEPCQEGDRALAGHLPLPDATHGKDSA